MSTTLDPFIVHSSAGRNVRPLVLPPGLGVGVKDPGCVPLSWASLWVTPWCSSPATASPCIHPLGQKLQVSRVSGLRVHLTKMTVVLSLSGMCVCLCWRGGC